ncbi:hypothetical protein NQ318_003744 [Aromia moschata]|uniref:Uncharacterized protein n=1 Tax=Aromia moschata TaxID=1265417 RepID=A0AAV8YIK1_9CUCU|nr:hypothetical protein NQ318_003744 [Aromia moschata]
MSVSNFLQEYLLKHLEKLSLKHVKRCTKLCGSICRRLQLCLRKAGISHIASVPWMANTLI